MRSMKIHKMACVAAAVAVLMMTGVAGAQTGFGGITVTPAVTAMPWGCAEMPFGGMLCRDDSPFMQDAPPPVPDTPVEPATPVVPDPAPEPEPEAPDVRQQALAAFQLVLDTVSAHDRGAADLAEAEAAVITAEGTMTRAQQHLADVTAERAGSAGTVVGNARAAIGVLEALIVEYSPTP